ncbi:unnamed protein product [Amoebophrya sp. A120]|nr:unnamed protein product [Amoebophrya sp. A120]|eukprot:GSA120T00025816001.1
MKMRRGKSRCAEVKWFKNNLQERNCSDSSCCRVSCSFLPPPERPPHVRKNVPAHLLVLCAAVATSVNLSCGDVSFVAAKILLGSSAPSRPRLHQGEDRTNDQLLPDLGGSLSTACSTARHCATGALGVGGEDRHQHVGPPPHGRVSLGLDPHSENLLHQLIQRTQQPRPHANEAAWAAAPGGGIHTTQHDNGKNVVCSRPAGPPAFDVNNGGYDTPTTQSCFLPCQHQQPRLRTSSTGTRGSGSSGQHLAVIPPTRSLWEDDDDDDAEDLVAHHGSSTSALYHGGFGSDMVKFRAPPSTESDMARFMTPFSEAVSSCMSDRPGGGGQLRTPCGSSDGFNIRRPPLSTDSMSSTRAVVGVDTNALRAQFPHFVGAGGGPRDTLPSGYVLDTDAATNSAQHQVGSSSTSLFNTMKDFTPAGPGGLHGDHMIFDQHGRTGAARDGQMNFQVDLQRVHHEDPGSFNLVPTSPGARPQPQQMNHHRSFHHGRRGGGGQFSQDHPHHPTLFTQHMDTVMEQRSTERGSGSDVGSSNVGSSNQGSAVIHRAGIITPDDEQQADTSLLARRGAGDDNVNDHDV